VREGEFLVLVGPSGCGKSTLLRIIAGLDEVDQGDVMIGDTRVNDLPPAKRGIAMVFQSYALYPHMNLYDNMAFGLRRQVKSADEIDTAVRAAAKLLDIEHLLERRPKALSGGQRQRVAIGRAIVRNPSVFLFDEPLSNLDAALRVRMRYEFAKLHERLRTTTVYVTHDQVEAMTLADRIAILDRGAIQQLGTPEDLYERPATKFVASFIGSPRMNFIEGVLAKAKNGLAVRVDATWEFPVSVGITMGKPGESVTLGIRPEHLEVSPQGIPAEVALVEWLGNVRFAYLSTKVSDEPLIMQLSPDAKLAQGEVLTVSAAAEACHVFDSEGVAIARSGYDPGSLAA
jgi:multiple sugar transport system ATP-binding protein